MVKSYLIQYNHCEFTIHTHKFKRLFCNKKKYYITYQAHIKCGELNGYLFKAKIPPPNTNFHPLIEFTKPNVNLKYILTHYCDKQGGIFVYWPL